MPVSRLRKRQKIFGMPATYGMDRNQRVQIMAYVRGYNARHKTKRQHTGPITRAFVSVLSALVWGFANTKTGSCFPSYGAIAARAGCAPSTVAAAIAALEATGIMQVVNRIKRVPGGVQRTSNAYIFRAFGPLAPSSENRSGNQGFKESRDSSAEPPPRVTILNPKSSMIDAALARFGLTAGLL